MTNWLLLVIYVLCSVSGSTLMKYGSSDSVKPLFVIHSVDLSVSAATLCGVLFYGLSFIFYIVLLSKFDLSVISPLTVGIVYVLLMVTAFVFFKEDITFVKILGSGFILLGIIMILQQK